MTDPLPFPSRVWFAWVCFFRVLFDAAFASRAWAVRTNEPKLKGHAPPPALEPPPDTSALLLLGLCQREGRLVDFLQQEITAYSDAEIGAVARVVHDGCRKALASHVTIVPVRTESEGGEVTLAAGFDPSQAKLVGNVRGSGPYRGILRHRGWRAEKVELPQAVQGHDLRVLCPAEVEL